MTNSLEVYRRKLYAFFHHPSCVGFEEKHLGLDYPDKTFLVIQRYAPANAGLLSFYMTTLGWIRYAVAHNMTPVVDMRTWLNQCLEINEVGRLNAWEFYFNQPCGFSLEDIKSAKNILIAHDPVSPLHVYLADMLSQEEVRMEVYSLAQKYVRIKEASLVSFNNPELECALKDPTSCVIGVRARGADYNVVRPAGHAIQPSAQCFIDKIREFPQNFKIYLVSEDKSIIDQIVCAFGDRVILSKQSLPEYHGGWMPNCRTKDKSRREEGAGYLKAIMDLSRCPILLAGRNNGTAAACTMTSGFTYFHLFDLGDYPM